MKPDSSIADFRKAQYLRSDSVPEEQLNWSEPTIGLFHYRIIVATAILRSHRQPEGQFSSIQYWIHLLKRNPGMFNFQTQKIKDFRACNQLLEHLSDAHILAAIATAWGITKIDHLRENLRHANWRKLMDRMAEKFSNFDMVQGLREQADEERDLIHENAVLFLQHTLIYRRFTEAQSTGDSGYVLFCLKVFTIWFLNTHKSVSFRSYRRESLHLMACLKYIWSPEFIKFWMDNCLVNLSGKTTGFMACDLLCEHVVRECKAKLPKPGTPAMYEFFRDVSTREIMVSKDIRDHMIELANTFCYQHSSSVKADGDVFLAAQKLLDERVFTHTPGRTQSTHSTVPATPAIDMYHLGLVAIADGKVITDYQQRMYVNTGSESDGNGDIEPFVDEESVVECLELYFD